MNKQKRKHVWTASKVFAPDFPRQSASQWTIQDERNDRTEFCAALEDASSNGMPGYYSVYSFPRGHSRDGNIPKVDCIFIDLDVEGNHYDPKHGSTSFHDWEMDMSALLARARMIASAILDAGEEHHFRVVLSGHKGLHIYLDFSEIHPANGDFEQFKNGLKSYGEEVVKWLDELAGGVDIAPWVDVDASDLGRLARFPNTIHHEAKYDDKTRWCVPITVEELAELHVEDYLELTSEPRWIDGYERNPSETAKDKVVQFIRTASSSQRKNHKQGVTYNPSAVKNYEEQANDNITLEDIPFLTSNKPCIEAFRKRDDAFSQGNASHLMEISIIGRLVDMDVPRNVIHQFFAEIPGYSESVTDEQIDKVIGREYSEFNCENITQRAPQFCLGNQCSLYQRSDDLQK